MVNIGFICEGDTEQIFLVSDNFQLFLASVNLRLIRVINACGAGNLLPHNINGYISILENAGAEVIFVLTDLDEDICITKTKQRISPTPQDIVIIAVKKIEAWFLANDHAMKALLKVEEFSFDEPEKEQNPFLTINNLLVEHLGRGIGKYSAGKIRLVARLIDVGFQIEESSKHAKCSSAKYFVNKLIQAGRQFS